MLVSASKGLDMRCVVKYSGRTSILRLSSYFKIFHLVLVSVQLIIGRGGDMNFAFTHEEAQCLVSSCNRKRNHGRC